MAKLTVWWLDTPDIFTAVLFLSYSLLLLPPALALFLLVLLFCLFCLIFFPPHPFTYFTPLYVLSVTLHKH